MMRALAIASVAITISSAVVAQQPAPKLPKPPDTTGDDCYWVFPPNREGSMVTSILLNRCSGDTWMLRPARTSEGKTVWRWFPLRHDVNEYAMQRDQSPTAPPRD
jgi:hypothetical protein